MENYQDYYADLNDRSSNQQQYWTVQNPSKNTPDAVQKPFLRYRIGCSKNVHERTINEKASRSGENRRYGGLILMVFVLGISACFAETLMHVDTLIQICSYLSALCYFFATDPIRALYRAVAPQSRIILTLITAASIVGLICKYQEYIIIASLLSLAGLFGIWKCNQSWLSADNWLMSEYVQRAIRASSVDTARIDEVWQTYGRRECNTLLYEMGYEITELDRIHRAVWLTGWMRGYEKTVKLQQRLEAAEGLKKDYKYLKKNYSALQKKDAETERIIKELEARAAEDSYQYAQIQKLYNQTRKENEQLQAANQELLEEIIVASADQDQTKLAEQPDQTISVPPAKIIQLQQKAKDTKKQIREKKVLEALSAGMSLEDAGKYAGCSKGTAFNIKKAHEESQKIKK